MIPEFWQEIIREQVPLDEGLKEEIAQSGGFTVRQLEEFLAAEGLE
jgi:hypothetical protein